MKRTPGRSSAVPITPPISSADLIASKVLKFWASGMLSADSRLIMNERLKIDDIEYVEDVIPI
jgi:hypothetical protein